MALRKLLSLLIALVMILSLSAISAFAEEGDRPFVLESSSVVDGDMDISVHPVIELVFSKKVDDISVLSQNKDRFHLQDSAGTVVPLSVLFPDTQVQNRFVNHVFLVPEADLAAGAVYTLTIDRGIADKKENVLSQSYVIHFTTATDEAFAKLQVNEDLTSLGDDVLTYQTALPPAAGAADTTEPAASVEDTASEDTDVRTVILIAVPLLLALLGFVFFRSLKASKRDSATDE